MIPIPTPAIYSLFDHISDERQIVRLTNKSLVCTKLYLFYSSCIFFNPMHLKIMETFTLLSVFVVFTSLLRGKRTIYLGDSTV